MHDKYSTIPWTEKTALASKTDPTSAALDTNTAAAYYLRMGSPSLIGRTIAHYSMGSRRASPSQLSIIMHLLT
jgi:hypothetical protein